MQDLLHSFYYMLENEYEIRNKMKSVMPKYINEAYHAVRAVEEL